MKNVFFALFLIIGSMSCSVQRETHVFIDDFRPYTKAGFFISPDPYVGNFEPMGKILIRIYPGTVKYNQLKANREKLPLLPISSMYNRELFSSDELIKDITDRAKSMGADAVVNYKSTIIFKGNSGYINITCFEVEGFAIKRK